MKLNTVICGKAEDVLKTFPDGCIDLTVTSPPYDNLRTYHGYEFNFKCIAQELYRVTKQGGVVVWVVGDSVINESESGISFKQALYFKEIGFNLHDTMIYQKNNNPFPETVRYAQKFEYMFIFSKGRVSIFNPLKDRKNLQSGIKKGSTTRQKDGKTKKMKTTTISEFGMRGNVWKYDTGFNKTTKDTYAFQHPAMYPEKLAGDHILSWSNKGDTVLDPMCGSGTTLKMAKELGRNYIGIEISPEYCKIAERRLSQGVLPF